MLQRAMIAMAIACEPCILIADEPTTALDVTIQAQVLDLLAELQKRRGTAIILITHDLGVVARMADDVAVMYAGQIVEKGTVDDIFYRPAHPYTVGLRAAMPSNEPGRDHRLMPIDGSPPDLFSPPAGCAYAARCLHAMKICAEHDPAPFQLGPDHFGKCWLHHTGVPDGLETLRSPPATGESA
jgi:oligopeptide/dipeptide ABC transporter ATP-binding protein